MSPVDQQAEPRVSCVVPFLNGEAFFRETIDAVLKKNPQAAKSRPRVETAAPGSSQRGGSVRVTMGSGGAGNGGGSSRVTISGQSNGGRRG